MSADSDSVRSAPELVAAGDKVIVGSSSAVHVDRTPPSLAVGGVLDAYADYLVLAQAYAVVVSNSFFGETAAEIGKAPAFYFEGCARIDLSTSA